MTASWTDVIDGAGLVIRLRPHGDGVPTFPAQRWFDVEVVVSGRQMSAHLESTWFDDDVDQLSVVFDALARSRDATDDAPATYVVDADRAASLKFTTFGPVRAGLEGEVDDRLAIEIWLTASGDDPSDTMSVLLYLKTAELVTGAAAARAVIGAHPG